MSPQLGKTAVTGAAGFLGAHICRALLQCGADVRAINRANSSRSTPSDLLSDVEWTSADVRDAASLAKAFRGCKTVINSAALLVYDSKMGEAAHAVNGTGPRNVAEACRRSGVGKLVHISSIHAFGPLKGVKLNQDTPLHIESKNVYTASKAAGHRDLISIASQHGISASTVCPSGLIGPQDAAPSVVGAMILAIAGRKIPLVVKEGYWWCDVRDAASAAVKAAEIDDGGGVDYLIGGRYASLPEIARMCSDAIGRNVSRPTVPLWLAEAGLPFIKILANLRRDMPLFSAESIELIKDCPASVDSSLAARILGHSSRPLKETIGDALRWSIENGMLTA